MKRYVIITKHQVYGDYDPEDEREVELRYEEQVSKLETLGFKYKWGTNYLCHFFDSVFFDEDTNITSIPEAIEYLAIKDGVDLVQFSNGNYGFVAYYNGYKNGFEIIG